MRDTVIVDAVRTPVGAKGKGLREIHPAELSAHVLRSLVERTELEPAAVDDVVWGCVSQFGEQAGNLGRTAVLAARWPESVPATTVDRQCGSSQQACEFAAALVISGLRDVVVAGGAESMTRVPMGAARGGADSPLGPSVEQRYGTKQFNQGTGADLIAKRWNLSRERLDELSLESHARAARATDQGAFASQIAPLAGLDADQGIRRGDTMETMASLKPAFGPDGLHTAGSSSQISDGAAALLITTSERAAERGWRPIARFHTSLVVGVDPVTMLTGPIPATERLLDRAGLDIGDIGVFEINEAFAAVLGAWLDETGAEHKRVNPLGGAIALGHPLGGSGARLMTTLVHHMRDNNIRYGLQAMCEGGGMANATLLELL